MISVRLEKGVRSTERLKNKEERRPQPRYDRDVVPLKQRDVLDLEIRKGITSERTNSSK